MALNIFIMLFSSAVLALNGCRSQEGIQNPSETKPFANDSSTKVRFVPELAPPLKPEHLVIFKDKQIAFALGDYYYLLRTIDEGNSWQRLRPASEDVKLFGGEPKNMTVLFRFISASRGWMSAERGVWQTEDGGNTWHLIFSHRWKTIDFADEQRGWLSLYFGGGYVQNHITRNGGVTWQPCAFAKYENTPSRTHFLTPEKGWGITCQRGGSGKESSVTHTKDSGCHWERVWGIKSETGDCFNSLYFLSDNEGWVADESHLYHTVNAGKEWLAKPLPIPGVSVREIFFLNPQEGWVIASEQGKDTDNMFHTTNAGKTWAKLMDYELNKDITFPATWPAGNKYLFQLSLSNKLK